MIKSAVRGVVVTALTTTLTLLPALAQAEVEGKDNDNETVELTGVNWLDTTPERIAVGDSWGTRLQLYIEKKAKKPDKKQQDQQQQDQQQSNEKQQPGKQPKQPSSKQPSSKQQPVKKQLEYVGDGESECSAVRVHDDHVTTQCTRTLRLKKGTLTLSDMITYNPEKGVTARTGIIGGTGHYRSAYGDGSLTMDGRYVYLKLYVEE